MKREIYQLTYALEEDDWCYAARRHILLSQGKVPWMWGDSHRNATGHRLAAEEIAAWDEVRGWQRHHQNAR